MVVVTTHTNADFDCLGALTAASRLYPGALLAFPGSQEKNLRDFSSRHPELLPPLVKAREINLDAVRCLIIVDCQDPGRIGRFSELLGRPGVEIHVFDHHPSAPGSIPAGNGIIRPAGSCSSMLCGVLADQGCRLTPAEATTILLGIHEDTGRLLFSTTTADDYRAAAWLLEQGASLQVIADALQQELSPPQMELLKALLATIRTTTVNGIPVTVAHASAPRYIGDIAAVAHMIRDMENLDALFLAVEMEGRVYLVGRSRVPEVDAGEILRRFNGGGHAAAASASVHGVHIRQVLQHLEEVIRLSLSGGATAAGIMSSPVKTVRAGISIGEARDMLTRYNCNAMPVMDGDSMSGIISRKIVEKALYHGLGDMPVTDFMHTDYMRATPETPLRVIQSYMIEGNRRFVPVFNGEVLVGAVTRTDLMRHMHRGTGPGSETLYDVEHLERPLRIRSISSMISKRLPPRVVELLRSMGAVADQLSMQIFAVGGFVRDLVLGVDNLDIDVTVEGDGIFFAEAYAARNGGRVRSHELFGTAVILLPDDIKIDVASTRLEYYESPGALPTVERASLRHDLYRRDFTINTLAFCLNNDHFGRLIDHFNGQQDLQERVVRVLHNLSFVEDPTRVFRAIRFEQRLDFRIAPHTEGLIKTSVRMNLLENVGGARLRNELIQMLNEKEPAAAISRMASLGVLPYIHPALKLTPSTSRVVAEAGRVLGWFRLSYLEEPCNHWQVYFLALCDHLNRSDFEAVCTRLAIRERDREHVFSHRQRALSALATLQRRTRRSEACPASELYALLNPLPVETLLYLAARTVNDAVRRMISTYMTRLRRIHCSMTGSQLRELGLAQGPRVGLVLRKLRNARLDGIISDDQQERELALALIAADDGALCCKNASPTPG